MEGQTAVQLDERIKLASAGATTNDLKLTDLTLEIEYLNKYIFFYEKNIYRRYRHNIIYIILKCETLNRCL